MKQAAFKSLTCKFANNVTSYMIFRGSLRFDKIDLIFLVCFYLRSRKIKI